MYLKNRLKKLENQINITFVRLDVNDEIIKTTSKELWNVFHEILQSFRESRKPEHKLLSMGILKPAANQNDLLNIINIINQSIRENKVRKM